ncbi:DUF333 domain-containing protein [Shewanella psychropiezotolerans]|uniref:DUF333 domain-containing protein n=1 Tax=Shewanella psychropiezotolerans TaxID=2593655 RepID=A0ABX5WXY1_9GAMM|nr:DUF333 domain-containing protein [Shewanella psychropiezotolerans]QDO83656.1 DUF333 domain-containing protein [Shewanella psychropiezotolerans]
MKNMHPGLFSKVSFEKVVNGVFLSVGLLTIILALAACCLHEEAVMANMSNPASDYCITQGGELEIVTGPDGQQGICTLPSGEVIEEWALYHRDHQDK